MTEALRDHWARPAGPRCYYWYLTFAGARQLHRVAAACQREIGFPYYDLVPRAWLHLTLERVAFEGSITPAELDRVLARAGRACREIAPFRVTAGTLSLGPEALVLTVSPGPPVRELRRALRRATAAAYPAVRPPGQEIPPHVTLAYANTDGVPAAAAAATAARLSASLVGAEISVTEASLVLLARRRGGYTWQELARVPLTGHRAPVDHS